MENIDFRFEHSYKASLVRGHIPWSPRQVSRPRLVYWNARLAQSLTSGHVELSERALAEIFSGNRLPDDAQPIAQVYAGHQFGHFSPQLGDGRALLIGEVIDPAGRRRDIALKGSGKTPFSRQGDGKAALGPMLREVIIGEALHALGVPTTRALAVVSTGEHVRRSQSLPGAVLTRVASSHIRVGTFEYFAARGDLDSLRTLADYTLARHHPELSGSPTPYLGLLQATVRQQAMLIARWMGLGFIHGVMNTDNMSMAGESIDFGPCAFMEAYDPASVFSSIDERGRYAYGKQPEMAQWNLARLAEALLPLIHPQPDEALALASRAVDAFSDDYRHAYLQVMRNKLGLSTADDAQDALLLADWLTLLETRTIDFTQAWWQLARTAEGQAEALTALFAGHLPFQTWLARWQARCAAEDRLTNDPRQAAARATRMLAANPAIIARNHLVESALNAATEEGDLAPFRQLLAAVTQPSQVTAMAYTEPAPAAFTARYRTFCGT